MTHFFADTWKTRQSLIVIASKDKFCQQPRNNLLRAVEWYKAAMATCSGKTPQDSLIKPNPSKSYFRCDSLLFVLNGVTVVKTPHNHNKMQRLPIFIFVLLIWSWGEITESQTAVEVNYGAFTGDKSRSGPRRSGPVLTFRRMLRWTKLRPQASDLHVVVERSYITVGTIRKDTALIIRRNNWPPPSLLCQELVRRSTVRLSTSRRSGVIVLFIGTHIA